MPTLRFSLRRPLIGLFLSFWLTPALFLTTTADAQQAQEEKKPSDKNSSARLRAVRELMSQIQVKSESGDERIPLDLKPDPILRYNDVTRGILDSVVFRVGTKGRPTALISAELYGRNGQDLLLNHEFVALAEPDFELIRDQFVWQPTSGNLNFQRLPKSDPPAENPRQRLVQMRRISEQFTASQTVGKTHIELRRMPAPLDRYEPNSEPRADGSIFAFAWGVNPEAALFIESDGNHWLYAWAPLSSAPLEAKRDGQIVWTLKNPPPHEDRGAPYTSIHRRFKVPEYFDETTDE